MGLTRITKGVIKPNEDYITGIITATGIDVNGNADISGNTNIGGNTDIGGNLSVQGVLTYEDVTSIDSVGIITAKKEVHVGAGLSVVGLSTFSNGVVVKTGTATTALIVEGNARVTGILTIGTGSLTITDRDINAVGVVTGSNFKTGTSNVHNVGIEVAQINVLGGPTKIGSGVTITHEGNFQSIGISTALQFKTGTTNVHNVGIEVAQLNVLGGATKIGSGATIYADGGFESIGVATATNFKTGTSNLHNVGIELAGINVLGADTPIGLGATVFNTGDIVSKSGAEFQGIVTATSFVGDGLNLTNTGSSLSEPGSGTHRLVTTSLTSGTMTSSGTDSTLTFDFSTHTLSATNFSGNLNASQLSSGTIPIARLGSSGTKSGGTFLAGDNTFKTVTVAINSIDNDGNNRLLTSDGDATATAESNLTFDGSTLTLAADTTDVLNFSASSTNDRRGISFNNRTALTADYNDGYLRLNDSSEFSNGVFTPGNFRTDGNLIFGSNNYSFQNGNNNRNAKYKASGTGDIGITGYDGNDAWRFQLYGTSGAYGFLDGNWAGWDIKKTINGEMQLDISGTLRTVWHTGNLPSYSSSASTSTLVQRDGSGYIFANYINTTNNDMGANVPNRVYVSDDNYHRRVDLGSFRSLMNAGGMGRYNGREQSTSDSNYWTGAMGWGTIDFNTVAHYGCGSIDIWSNPGNQPSGTSHWVGSQHLHYTTNSGNPYGHQIVVGAGNPDLMYVRGNWGSGWTSWKKMLNEGNYSGVLSTSSILYIDVYSNGHGDRNTANSWAQSAVSIPNDCLYIIRFNYHHSYWVGNHTGTSHEDRRTVWYKNSSGSVYWAGVDRS